MHARMHFTHARTHLVMEIESGAGKSEVDGGNDEAESKIEAASGGEEEHQLEEEADQDQDAQDHDRR